MSADKLNNSLTVLREIAKDHKRANLANKKWIEYLAVALPHLNGGQIEINLSESRISFSHLGLTVLAIPRVVKSKNSERPWIIEYAFAVVQEQNPDKPEEADTLARFYLAPAVSYSDRDHGSGYMLYEDPELNDYIGQGRDVASAIYLFEEALSLLLDKLNGEAYSAGPDPRPPKVVIQRIRTGPRKIS